MQIYTINVFIFYKQFDEMIDKYGPNIVNKISRPRDWAITLARYFFTVPTIGLTLFLHS